MMPFDPSRQPRPPASVSQLAKDRQEFFDQKLAEDGFSVQEAESLGWVVDHWRASKHFPGRGLVEVHSRLTDEGRYGVLKEIYEEELKEHQRARARAMEIFRRLVKEDDSLLRALEAANAAREKTRTFDFDSGSDQEWAAHCQAHDEFSSALDKALGHAKQRLVHLRALDGFTRPIADNRPPSDCTST